MSAQYKRKDHYYKKAKEEGYRSRAAYKLLELNQRFGLLKPGFKVLDLGAAPGGWLQVESQCIGTKGLAVGIDLEKIEELQAPNVKLIVGDVFEEGVLNQAMEYARAKFDLLLSDMAPNLSGIPEVDQTLSASLGELSLNISQRVLRKGGNFVVKVFKGRDTEDFIRKVKERFTKVVRVSLDSTRKSSNEFYVAAFGLEE